MRAGLAKGIAILAFALIFLGVIISVDWPTGGQDSTTMNDVGKTLFGQSSSEGFGLVMFLIGLLLLVALLGGVFLAKEEEKE
jgi:NADH:ubiquinone oxidoreductase subunit 6 (subunit J)